MPELPDGLRWRIVNETWYGSARSSDYLHLQKRSYVTKIFTRKIEERWETLFTCVIGEISEDKPFQWNYAWSVEWAAKEIMAKFEWKASERHQKIPGRNEALCVVNDDCD